MIVYTAIVESFEDDADLIAQLTLAQKKLEAAFGKKKALLLVNKIRQECAHAKDTRACALRTATYMDVRSQVTKHWWWVVLLIVGFCLYNIRLYDPRMLKGFLEHEPQGPRLRGSAIYPREG